VWKAGLLASCHHQHGHAAARVTSGALRSDIPGLASPCTRPGRAGQGQSWAPRCTGWTSSSCKGCWGARRSLSASRVTSRACAPVSGRSSARGCPHYPGGGGGGGGGQSVSGGPQAALPPRGRPVVPGDTSLLGPPGQEEALYPQLNFNSTSSSPSLSLWKL